jgi:dCMP deaminase
MRLTWDQVWMATAEAVSRRSLCTGRQVGAAVVGPSNRYLVVGYNGPPAGFDHADQTCEHWCEKRAARETSASYAGCPSVHAETNALSQADRHLIAGGTLYVTSACCWDCGKVVANSGVARVVMQVDWNRDQHRDPMTTINFLVDCHIAVDVWDAAADQAVISRRKT